MLPPPRRHWTGGIAVIATLLHCAVASAVSYNNQTLTGTVLLPAGDYSQAHSFTGTITLDNAIVDNEGYLRNEQQPVIVQGNGLINIRGPMGIWTNGWVNSHLTIRPGVEVNGYHGTAFNADGVNQGTIAAVPGGSGGIWGTYFHMGVDNFQNEGLIEVRSGATMTMYLMDGLFENDGTIRVHPTATLDLAVEEGSPLTPANLGVIENNGLVKLNQFRMSGAGEFELAGAGVWEFQRYTEIIGSTLTITASATARIISTSSPPAHFRGVTINGVMNSAANSDAAIHDGLTLNGQWRTAAGAELYFNGPQTIGGSGQFIADGNSTFLASGGTTTFGPDVDLIVPGAGWLSLSRTGTPVTLNPYIIHGDVAVSGGSFGSGAGVTESFGDVHASAGGSVTLGSTFSTSSFVNHGSIRVDSGATLRVAGTLTNNGTATVENANLRLDAMPQGNPISITDSTIYAANFNQTLTQLQALPRTRSEIVAAATVNLEGQTLTIADQDNSRWAIGTGGYQNGTIDSADGFELRTLGSGAVLRNLTLDADARVTSGKMLQINANVTGAGDIIVDGGGLQFGGYGNTGEPMTSDAVAKVVPQPDAAGSKVMITGPMDNAGRTIYLKAGAAWELDVLRSKGITGGRIEGDPGVELQIRGYGSGPPTYGDLNGVTLATAARVLTGASVDGGLNFDGGVLTIGIAGNGQFPRSSVTFYGASTLGGNGEVRFEGPAPSTSTPYPRVISTSSPLSRLTVAPGVTVRTSGGDGAFFYGNQFPGALTNEGRLLAENGHKLTLITGDFTQRGTLRATSNSTLAVIDSSLTNEGRLEASGGHITFTGDLVQSPAAAIGVVLAFPLPPLTPPSIQAAGAITLDGTLELHITPGYAPSAGNSFKLIEAAGGITGDFDAINLPTLATGLYWSFDAQPTALNLTVAAGAPPGDFTFNGQIDGADFLAWQRGQSPNPLSAVDLTVWLNHFGASAAATAFAPVPEPAALSLLCVAIATLWRRR